jgi:cell division protease FtsH
MAEGPRNRSEGPSVNFLEIAPVQKRGKERGRSWLTSGGWMLLMLLMFSLGYMFVNRESNAIVLRYDQLTKILTTAQDDPSIHFENVKVGRDDIRGDIVVVDPVSDGDKNEKSKQPISFRAQRRGLEEDRSIHELLKKAAPGYDGEPEESAFKGISSMIFTFVLLGGLVVGAFMLLRWFSGGSSPLTFGRSRHKLYAQKDLHITFEDVAGIDEAKTELLEVVDFLKSPGKYQALGGRIPKGVLLVGPPGTGKTLLAKAVAGEADVPFFSLSGSDFVEMFVGVGAARVRDLFAQAESRAPCIIFIDELDALGKTRTGSTTGGEERESTLNQLLVEMDGFDSNRGVIIMAASNRPETLDQALLRPGRFDRTIVVDRPDLVGREAILKVHARNVRTGKDIDLRRVAGLTPGTVGADLANLVNEAALMAARNNQRVVTMANFEEAIERGAVGLERKSRIMHADEKHRVACHEAGHAIVSCALPNTHPVHKVSIIPRGVGALGYVLSRPEEDRYLMTRSELESQIKVALGGTMAEEIVFREVSNGATSDLEHASRLARSMVKEYGMSQLGRVNYQPRPRNVFLPPGFSEVEREFSEQTAREIDVEVRRIIDVATNEVRDVLLARRQALDALTKLLIEKEVIDGAVLRQMLDQFTPNLKLVPGSGALEDRVTGVRPVSSEDADDGDEPSALPPAEAAGGAG